MNFSGKKVLVVGLGESGLAISRWLARCGAELRVADTRNLPERLVQLRGLSDEIEFIGGDFQENLLEDRDLIVLSPGLSPLIELRWLLEKAEALNIPIWGELELFSLALSELKEKNAYQPKVIAITGTNGKTTVTNLTEQLCNRAGLTAKVAGNISPSLLDVLCDCIDSESLPQVWVLELSSFQLHTNISFNPDVAVVLNVTQDHLDWHGNLQNYTQDKARIFGDTTIQVLNRDDPLVMGMKKNNTTVLTFGMHPPELDGEFGLITEYGMSWLAVAVAQEEELLSSRKRKKDLFDAETIVTRLMPTEALQIRGMHNATNALAAMALCRAIDLPLAPLLHGLREYKGEPHRVELVMSINDVQYFDDSKGTNVGATVAALKGLGSEQSSLNKRIILIAGGDGKGQDFSPLISPVERYVKAVFLIGKDASIIENVLEISNSTILKVNDLEQAVIAASELAEAGDIVLLSPACASLDMFKNYVHRAEIFIDAVREVALINGEIC
jgi:UDP-N-acetylmuramoylalanine--D-glutamate ligase